MTRHENNTRLTIILSIIIYSSLFPARSPHRPQDPTIPTLSTRWIHDKEYYTLKNHYLQEYPFFEIFDYNHFFANYLPLGPITFRYNPDMKVNGTIIAHLIDDLVEEVHQKKRFGRLKKGAEFKDFTVLRHRNFNYPKKWGFLILRCKEYPFVVKLSIETPESFTQPFQKGFEPSIFFMMAGGINRHLSGFTRIKNATNVRNRIARANLPVEFDIPRKWFYIPQNCKWIELAGTHIGHKKHLCTEIPGTYCIIADAIEYDRKFSLLYKDDRIVSMRLCNLINFSIDPHIDNFLLEKGTGKIVIVDTEHFPSITGLTEVDGVYTSQLRWYADLSLKCIRDMFFRDKETQRTIQRRGTHHYKL